MEDESIDVKAAAARLALVGGELAGADMGSTYVFFLDEHCVSTSRTARHRRYSVSNIRSGGRPVGREVNVTIDPPSPVSTDDSPTPDQPPTAPSRRIIWVVLIVVAVAALSVLALTQGRAADRRSTGGGGGTAAPFTLENLRPGQPQISLESLQGKPVVLNFWASWCVPCRREMPAFQAAYEALGDRVAFLGIDNKDYRDAALDFLRQTGAQYPSGFDPAGNIATRYGVVGMPTTFFISRDGRLLERRLGEISGEELRQTISRLFGVS